MMYPPVWLVWLMLGASSPYVVSAVLSAGIGAIVSSSRTAHISEADADRIAAKVVDKINK
jgi:hypothetical protein